MNFVQRVLAACVLLAAAAFATEGLAQADQSGLTPRIFPTYDSNNVDLTTGRFKVSGMSMSIGVAGQGEITWARDLSAESGDPYPIRDNLLGYVTRELEFPDLPVTGLAPYIYTVNIGGRTAQFRKCCGYTTFNGQSGSRGKTLSGLAGNYVLTEADGTVVNFGSGGGGVTNGGLIKTVTRPNGERLDYYYYNYDPQTCVNCRAVRSIVSNLGYMVKYSTGPSLTVKLISLAVDYCDPLAESCAASVNWPQISSAAGETDLAGRVSTYNAVGVPLYGGINNYTVSVTRPGLATVSADLATIVWSPQSCEALTRVASVTRATGVWTYGYAETWNNNCVINSVATSVTNPLGGQTLTTSRTEDGALLSHVDELTRQTGFTPGIDGTLAGILFPEGNHENYQFTSTGVVDNVTVTPKSGSGLSPKVQTATYPATCTDPGVNDKTCRKPLTTTDARGAVTTYVYDLNSGQATKVTGPAGPNGVQPETRNTYTALYAQYKNASGVLTPFATPVYKLTQTSTCVSGAAPACLGTADEVRTTYAYASANLWPTAVTVAAGDGSLSATTTTAYDMVGNVIAVDGPLPGADDTTTYRYDVLRRQVGMVGPAFVNNQGQTRRQATRTRYHLNGQADLVEAGSVAGLSEADWTAFAPLTKTLNSFDSEGRVIATRAQDGTGATQALTQMAYDAVGRVTCTALRMKPSTFAAPPASACTATTGAGEPDRITFVEYNAAGQMIRTTSGYGVAPRVEKEVLGYTSNGKEATVADGKGNQTVYVYDGFDRLSTVRYPSATPGGGNSLTDYDQYTFDENDNRTAWRKRDCVNPAACTVVHYTYDALNRLTTSDAPRTYHYYDNLGRPTWTYSGDQLQRVNVQSYDPLGRVITDWNLLSGTYVPVYSSYDLAGRRTRLQWSDGLHADYEYDAGGRMTGVRENGGGYLATFSYDNLGRRTALYRGNGAQTYYGYDAASRLSGLTHDLPGTAQDGVFAFGYNAAGQVTSRTATNAVYEPTVTPINRTYAINGLNQATTSGAVGLGYDLRGNLNCDGFVAPACPGLTYAYDPDNRLLGTSSGAALTYDPLGRLQELAAPGVAVTRLVYDGANLVAEYDAANAIVGRYVPGPGVDEPLVWYQGGGLTNRRWLLPDAQGSIVALTNSAGVATINTYDEYGVPGAGNIGRYQYTGQTWMPEVGLYNYKARVYSPTLGRFLQTDPIGYGDGLNWYAYVGNDPVNGSDPTGAIRADGSTDPNCYVDCNPCVKEKSCGPSTLPWPLTVAPYNPGGDLSDWAKYPLHTATLAMDELAAGCLEGGCELGNLSALGGKVSALGGEARLGASVLRQRGLGALGERLAQAFGKNRIVVNLSSTRRLHIDVAGRAHGGIPTPHVEEWRLVQIPSGKFAGEFRWQIFGKTRPATELDLLRAYLSIP